MTYHNRPKHKGTLASANARSERRDECKAERERAECVRCFDCGAKVHEYCFTSGGRQCKPHAVRVARSNGLARTPISGSFIPLKHTDDNPNRYSGTELLALKQIMSREEYATLEAHYVCKHCHDDAHPGKPCETRVCSVCGVDVASRCSAHPTARVHVYRSEVRS